MTVGGRETKGKRNIRSGRTKQKTAHGVRPAGGDEEIAALARRLGRLLVRRRLMCACAESCTGGSLAAAITAIPGSSAWFERGYVSYSNRSKIELLGVPATILDRDGAVSEAAARAMAAGALRSGTVQLSVAVTGIAGPGGARPGKPVGTVFFALARRGREPLVERRRFRGGRQAVRRAAVRAALLGLCALAED